MTEPAQCINIFESAQQVFTEKIFIYLSCVCVCVFGLAYNELARACL